MEPPAACAPPPAPAPVPVAWSVVPVDFKVFKKGTEMAMHDATGRLAFRVAGDGGGGTVLFDGAGGVLVTVRTSGQVINQFLVPDSVFCDLFLFLDEAGPKQRTGKGQKFSATCSCSF